MQVISFFVEKQEIRQVNNETLVNDSTNYLKFHFDFDSDWADVDKRVLFKATSDVYCKALDSNDDVIVPWEVLTGDYFTFSVYGVDDNDLRITTPQRKIGLARSGYTEDIEQALPATPSTVDDLYNGISAVDGKVNVTNVNLGNLTTDVNQVKSNIVTINSTLGQAVLDIKDAEDDIDSLQTDMTKAKSDITAIEGKLDNTIEMEVTFEDETTATYNVVVKEDESD